MANKSKNVFNVANEKYQKGMAILKSDCDDLAFDMLRLFEAAAILGQPDAAFIAGGVAVQMADYVTQNHPSNLEKFNLLLMRAYKYYLICGNDESLKILEDSPFKFFSLADVAVVRAEAIKIREKYLDSAPVNYPG